MTSNEEEIPYGEDWVGQYGLLENIPYQITQPEHRAHVCAYLITSPVWHPAWSQYMLSVVSLAEIEGVAPPKLQFPGATHELLVVALNPDKVYNIPTMLKYSEEGSIPYLVPVNIAHQFTATDDEMKKVAWLCGRAVVIGQLNPETSDAPDAIRETWLSSCVRTLAHMRGEEHASGV